MADSDWLQNNSQTQLFLHVHVKKVYSKTGLYPVWASFLRLLPRRHKSIPQNSAFFFFFLAFLSKHNITVISNQCCLNCFYLRCSQMSKLNNVYSLLITTVAHRVLQPVQAAIWHPRCKEDSWRSCLGGRCEPFFPAFLKPACLHTKSTKVPFTDQVHNSLAIFHHCLSCTWVWLQPL